MKRLLKIFGLFIIWTSLVSYCLSFRTSDERIYRTFAGLNETVSLRFFETATQRISYLEAGNRLGPTLIFIHGAPGSLDNYLPYAQNPDYLEKYHLILVDRHGYGKSGLGKTAYSIEEQALDFEYFLDLDKSGKIFVIGHSYGGPVAAEMGYLFPEDITAVMLHAPAIDPDGEKLFFFNKPLASVDFLLAAPFRVSNQEKVTHAEALAEIESHWKNIKIPVYNVHGEADNIVPYLNMPFLEERVPDSLFHKMSFSDVDHLFPLNDVNFTLDLINEMLENELQQ